MTRTQWFLLGLGVLLVTLVFPLVPILFWAALAVAAWYIKRIPERRLPLAAFFATHHPTFYNWLSGFLADWQRTPMFAFIALLILSVAAWGVLALRLVSLPIYGESVTPSIWINLDFWVHVAGFLFLLLNTIAFLQAKYMAWDVRLWEAEPSARALLGAEFDNLSEAEKTQLYRHLAEVSIGINKGTWLVSDGKCEVRNAPAETFAKFGGPGLLIVQEGHVAVLERGGRVSRIVGAGRHQLGPFERVSMVVYLPVRIETVHIKDALTHDKMFVKEFVLMVFHRVDRGDRSESSGQYDYDPKIIHEKIWSPRGNDWRGTIQAVTDSAVRDVIGRYNFEDIISISGEARLRLIQEFVASINEITQGLLGVEVPGANIGAITISDEAKRVLETRGLREIEQQMAMVNALGEKETLARRLALHAFPEDSQGSIPRKRDRIFISHGHDEVVKEKVKSFLLELGLDPVIYDEQPTVGQSLREKLAKCCSDASYAVILLTPDDVGFVKGDRKNPHPRARQNVIEEWDVAQTTIGRDKVCVIRKSDVEIPSNHAGDPWINWEDQWQTKLIRELAAAKISIDFERFYNLGKQ